MLDDVRTLAERLLDLGTSIAFPPTPPLAAMVADRLRQPGRRWGLARPIGRGMALAMAATVLLVGIAAAFGLGLGGLRLTFGPASFSPAPSLLVGPGLGEPTTLGEARQHVQFAHRLAGTGPPRVVGDATVTALTDGAQTHRLDARVLLFAAGTEWQDAVTRT